MNVILNIGLDAPTVAKDYEWSHQDRLARSLEACRVVFNSDYRGIVTMNNLLSTLVVVGTLPEPWREIVTRMSETLNQDCIAVWDLGRGEGHLIGAHAEVWRPFRRDLFVFPPEYREGPMQ